jgi:hypothetical protein
MHKSTLGSLAHFISSLAFRRGLPEIQLPVGFPPKSVITYERPSRQLPKLIGVDADLFFRNVVHMATYLTDERRTALNFSMSLAALGE